MTTFDLVSDRPERPSVLSVLKSSTVFNALTSQDIDDLAAVSHLAYAERGETIWFRGSQVDFFGLVGVGFVKMVRSFSNGQEATAEIMGPGQLFGLLGVIEGQGCPLTARSVCHCWYLKVPKTSILPIFEERIIFKDQLLRRTTQRFRQNVDVLAKMASGRVEERIALVLMLLSESYGREGEGGIEIQVPLTRQDIAEMAGTTVESTIRTMSRWQKEKVVKSDHMIVTIIDENALLENMRE